MRVADLDESVVGKRIRVIGVAFSEAEAQGFCKDTEVLMGQEGLANYFMPEPLAQLRVQWDKPGPGSLSLASNDEVEVLVG